VNKLAFEAWREELHQEGVTVLNNLITIYGNNYWTFIYNYLFFTGL
jgi:hypothetical protein